MRTQQSSSPRRLIYCFAALLCLSQAQAAERHMLWKVPGKENTVYLLGSVHVLKSEEVLPEVMEHAYQDAEALVMEIDMDDLDMASIQSSMLQLALLPADKTLQDIIGAEAANKLATHAQSLGLDAGMLSRFKPWFAAITLSQLQLMQRGLNPQSGVEMRFTGKAATDKKPITGLETLQEQLGFFADLSDAEQTDYLLYTIEEASRLDTELNDMLAAWRGGDAESLARTMDQGYDKFPRLYERLTTERNRRWIEPIEKLLKDRQDYLVIVGAIHLVGKDGVVDLLERRGYRVTQQ